VSASAEAEFLYYFIELSPYDSKIYVTTFFWMIFPCTVLLATSKASWLEDLPAEDLEDYANPTGKVQTHLFFMKYNVSVAAALFATALKKK